MTTPLVDRSLLKGAKQIGPLLNLLEEALKSKGLKPKKFDETDKGLRHKYVLHAYAGWSFEVEEEECALGIFFDEPKFLYFEVKGRQPAKWKRMEHGWFGKKANLDQKSFFDCNTVDEQRQIVESFIDGCLMDLRQL
jgi:hypothetical protein